MQRAWNHQGNFSGRQLVAAEPHTPRRSIERRKEILPRKRTDETQIRKTWHAMIYPCSIRAFPWPKSFVTCGRAKDGRAGKSALLVFFVRQWRRLRMPV